jgi:cysteine desulfurase/selenocysteine lyase
VNGKPLVYLDNAASSQVPQSVIDRTSKYLAEIEKKSGVRILRPR